MESSDEGCSYLERIKECTLAKSKKPTIMIDDERIELDEKTLVVIQLLLFKQVLHKVIHMEIAAGLWLKLYSFYMKKRLHNKIRIEKYLYTFEMSKGTSIQSHLDKFN